MIKRLISSLMNTPIQDYRLSEKPKIWESETQLGGKMQDTQKPRPFKLEKTKYKHQITSKAYFEY